MTPPRPDPASLILEDLYATIEDRRTTDPAASHAAKLFADGSSRIAKKVGEEAVEVVIAALDGDAGQVAEESADLIYHLLVLWADAGVRPDDVWSVLAGRTGISGIEEKKNRQR